MLGRVFLSSMVTENLIAVSAIRLRVKKKDIVGGDGGRRKTRVTQSLKLCTVFLTLVVSKRNRFCKASRTEGHKTGLQNVFLIWARFRKTVLRSLKDGPKSTYLLGVCTFYWVTPSKICFMNKIKTSNIALNRKMLSQLSILDPQTFSKIQTLVIEKTAD